MKQQSNFNQWKATLRCSLPLFLTILCLLTAFHAQSAQMPVCPTNSDALYPAYSELDAPPAVATWKQLESLPDTCLVPLDSPAALVVALAGRFSQVSSVDEIARRLGAITATKGLVYWSVTDKAWRELLSDAFALESQDREIMRPDFSAEEVLSGQALYFAQNDTRSWGLNIYRSRAISSSDNHLVFESDNVLPIRLGPLVLFGPNDIRSVLFIDRESEDTWAYYGLSVIRHTTIASAAREKSLINRQAAFYRLLTGQTVDQEPPLAPIE